jgi:hypothetical protein
MPLKLEVHLKRDSVTIALYVTALASSTQPHKIKDSNGRSEHGLKIALDICSLQTVRSLP